MCCFQDIYRRSDDLLDVKIQALVENVAPGNQSHKYLPDRIAFHSFTDADLADNFVNLFQQSAFFRNPPCHRVPFAFIRAQPMV